MDDERINNSLRIVLIFSLLTVALSNDQLSPGHTVYVIANSNLTFSCTTAVDWNLMYFRDNGLTEGTTSAVIFQRNTTHCRPVLTSTVLGADKYFAFPCYVNQPVSIMIRYINSTYHNKTIECQVDKREAVKTTVKIREMLTKPSMTASGKQTIKEMVSVNFTCTAKSIPKPSIEWYLNGSKVTSFIISSSPTENTRISTFTYKAKKEDQNSEVYCSANDTFTTLKSLAAELNITYRPIVTVMSDYNPYYVLENKTDVLLRCIVTDTNPAITAIHWKKNNIEIHTTSNYTIPRVQRDMTGNYTCDATNSVGTSNPSPKLQFYVLYGIYITPISKKEQREGEKLSIYCNGESLPPVTDNDVTWTKQNNDSFNSSNGRYLVIGNVNRLDAGIFVCSITKKLTPSGGQFLIVKGSATVEVDVLYRPTVTVSPKYNVYDVLENTPNIQLTCEVADANPMYASYWWLRNGSNIFNSAYFNIARVNRSDTGMYACKANNSVGISDLSTAINLKVMYVELYQLNETTRDEGTMLSVSCNGQSYPSLKENYFTWTKKNNNTFVRTGRQFVINNVNRNDSGTYLCSVIIKATPTVGESVNITGTTTVHVNILYRPTVILSPAYERYNVIENSSNLQLNCTVTDANPTVALSYKWYKESKQIFANVSYIIISTVQKKHSGNYTCVASNTVGLSEPSELLQLNVLYGVTINAIDLQQPHEGQHLTVTCDVVSNPKVTESDISWTKRNNNTFSGRFGRQFTIDNVSRLDSGIFVCSVTLKLTPSVGPSVTVAGTTTLNVDVLYRPTVVVVPVQNPYDVRENSSNVQLTCNVTSSNPNVMFFRWFKNDFELLNTAQNYTITTVMRTNSGYYTCDAKNSVGTSVQAAVLKLNVLYGVSLDLSATEIAIPESHKWNMSCKADGNPLPLITLVYKSNNSALVEKKSNTTSILVDHANCMDTGLYLCSGNNSIGDSVTHSADVRVACKPRTYTNLERQDIFLNGTDESLRIEAKFISYPLCDVSWYKESPEGNLETLDKEFNISNIYSDLPYETIYVVQKEEIKSSEFGNYIVNASNIHGSFLLTYHVSAKRAPDPPTNIIAICGVTSIKVSWKSKFNGGENQTFRIHFVNSKTNRSIPEDGIIDMENNTFVKETLNPDTWYGIFIDAYNVYGTTPSTETTNCTTDQRSEENQSVSSALVGGIAGSTSALLVVVVIIGGLYFWRRRQTDGGDKDLINRDQKETNEDEDGLRENPLYLTSGESPNADVGPVYGVVNKQRQNKKNIATEEYIDQGPVYSLVQKSNTQGKKKGKEKKEKKTANTENHTDIELGTVYENSDKVVKQMSSEELYANDGEHANVSLAKVYNTKKNKDGLIYADLDLIPGPSGKKFVIRGLENRTNYAIIDLSIKVDPLPSDDEDDDKDNTGTTSTLDMNNK